MDAVEAEPKIGLSVETSGRVGSVALGRGDTLLDTGVFTADRQHAVELLPTVRSVCRRHGVQPDQVGELFVSGGPGSFTGLRIGISFAKMVACAGCARVARIPTLDAIAQNALALEPPPDTVGVILDAKRGRVYAAAFKLVDDAEAHYRGVSEPAELDPVAFLESLPPTAAVLGEGVQYHRDAVERSGLHICPENCNRSSAEVVYRLGRRRAAANRWDDVATLTPIYIRRPEAEEVYERRFGPKNT
ncbi:MAG: tRNA (adenosine(37)-N6)-threonylcarbamoyltransferase complex dimerization subunit type 1 TsaB [bacterium]|nr:tRNA (adenosine(37)-N6)-threonylcarbamoyltransferase complex dimerization subunit type 1 TsaB [bacterium]